MAVATVLTSASGLLALLAEPEPKLKVYALNKLDIIVHEFWPEISDNIQQMYAALPLALLPACVDSHFYFILFSKK